MSKQGIYKISGNTKPKVGELTTYAIDAWYPATPIEKRNPALVTWHLFKKVNGKFVPTNIKKIGKNSFTFNTTAYKDTFRIEAYLHNPEGRSPMALEVQPQPNDTPKINTVELKYVDDTPGTVFSFTEKLIAEAKCMNLEAQYLQFTLWEDDSRDSGHNDKNLLIDSKKSKVINGTAKAEFILTKALMKKAMEGETDVKQLEFYVTVEYYENKKHASKNINISSPTEITPSKAPTSQPKTQVSPATQKGQSQKEKRGIIETTRETISGAVSEIGKKIYDWAEAKGTAKKDQKPTVAAPSGKSPTVVNPDTNTSASTCICKEQYKDLVWGGKVNCEFRKKVVQICSELWGESRKMEMAHGLMAVMNVETASSFKAHQIMGKSLGDVNSITKDDFWLIKKDKKTGKVISRSSRAVGLIQFTQAALQAIGEFTSGSGFDKLHEVKLRFAKMGEVNQLDYVKKYFEPSKNKIKSPEDIYLHVFAPKGVGKADDYILYESGTEEYRQNESVDTKSTGNNKNDGNIQRSEILERYHDSYKQGNSNKPQVYNCSNNLPPIKNQTDSKCPEDCSQCFEYADVVDNPKLNNQSDNVNKNRFHRVPRYNNNHPKGYFHTGTDVLTTLDTNLKSMLCGEVTEALDTGGDLGKIVTIKSKDKNGAYIWIRYCHLNSYSVSKGQKIKHGKILGKSGNTGNAKNILPQYYHVHIEASTDGVFYGGNTRVDPEQFMKTKFDETTKGNSIK